MRKYGFVRSGSGSQYKLFQDTNLEEEIKSKCQLCKRYEQIIDHLTQGAPLKKINT
jgi:hypothetical protein